MALDSTNRRFHLKTPVGEDAFLISSFRGREELSRPFHFVLDLVSDLDTVAPANLVGLDVSWTVDYPETSPRLFHGKVRKLTVGSKISRDLRQYQIEVVPWFWFLKLAVNCRIFQNQTTEEIVKLLFGEFGFTSFEFKLSGSLAKREYCVQYHESAFDFISRLLEDEGIYYYFNYTESSHVLVLANALDSYFDCSPHAKVEFRPDLTEAEAITAWERKYEYRPGKLTMTDYNFETPSTNLLSSANSLLTFRGIGKYEVFEFPGRFQVAADGSKLAKRRIAEAETDHDSLQGKSRCSSFRPGGKFEFVLNQDPASSGKKFVLTSVEHFGQENPTGGTGFQEREYRNEFQCIPAESVFVPSQLTPLPIIKGLQTAVVVGPKNEEIYTDKYSRVKVQFFWDRLGKLDEASSCWIRVSESWAGQKFGTIFLPRIGQEVIVDFLEGNPDRPMITGRVYNASQMPPYDLPANKTQSGLLTRSSLKGDASFANELRFEDKKDSEDIVFHAQKDFHRSVENDDDLKVGHDQTIEIKNNRTETVKEGNEKVTIEKGNREHVVSEGNESLTVTKGNREVKVDTGNDTHSVAKGNREVTVATGNDTHTISKGNREVTVATGNDTHTISKGNREVTVELGNDTLTVKTGDQTTKVSVGSSTTEATTKITLKVGGNSIEIAQSGITIKGLMVKIEGQTQTSIKGLITEVNADAMLKMQGGIVMVN
jgi:type VI secretion system secreted protein VgrG